MRNLIVAPKDEMLMMITSDAESYRRKPIGKWLPISKKSRIDVPMMAQYRSKPKVSFVLVRLMEIFI